MAANNIVFSVVHIANIRKHMYICRMAETGREKFVRLANKRVNNAIKALELIGNLSNRSNYDYTQEDEDKIFLALNRELKACRDRFNSVGSKRESKFSLE